jgi:hypothetical protein
MLPLCDRCFYWQCHNCRGCDLILFGCGKMFIVEQINRQND